MAADNDTDWPTSLDPAPVVLEDDVDFFPADALILAKNQGAAIEVEVGSDPADFTGGGGRDYGTIGAALLALCRWEVDVVTLANTQGGFRVDFTADRFTAPPIVLLTAVNSSEPTQRAVFTPKRVTKDGFTVGTGHSTRANAAGAVVNWLAIQAPFGLEESPDVDDVE